MYYYKIFGACLFLILLNNSLAIDEFKEAATHVDLASLEKEDNDVRLYAVRHMNQLFPDGATKVYRRKLHDLLGKIYCKASREEVLKWRSDKNNGKKLSEDQDKAIGLWEYLNDYMTTIEEFYLTRDEVQNILKENLAFKYISTKIYKDTMEQHGDYLEYQTRLDNNDARRVKPSWEQD